MENNLTNICILCMDICILTLWYYADDIDTDVKYGCLQMLDWLVSTHLFFSTSCKLVCLLI